MTAAPACRAALAAALTFCGSGPAALAGIGETAGCDAVGCDGAGGNSSLCEGGTLFDWGGRAAPGAGGPPPLDGALVTDRPSFTPAAVTVGRGVAQLESGYLFTYDDPGDGTGPVRRHDFGDARLRVGVVADWLELRLGGSGLRESAAPAPGAARVDVGGGSDLAVGVKLALAPQAGCLPETALIAGTTVPTGSAAFSADRALPGASLIYQWALDEGLSLAGSTQLNRRATGPSPAAVAAFGDAAGSTDDYSEFAQSAILSASLTDRLGAFGEYYALLPLSGAAADEHYLDGGFTVLLSDDVQYDARVGVGLNDAADDVFAGTGLSIRFR
ncbi:transporter [Alienimonas sp. DA493]|uniref:transporter n=1 Tax=Alienimonas sp. DA493 TaxID=3373605 RepID=UPI0037545C01